MGARPESRQDAIERKFSKISMCSSMDSHALAADLVGNSSLDAITDSFGVPARNPSKMTSVCESHDGYVGDLVGGSVQAAVKKHTADFVGTPSEEEQLQITRQTTMESVVSNNVDSVHSNICEYLRTVYNKEFEDSCSKDEFEDLAGDILGALVTKAVVDNVDEEDRGYVLNEAAKKLPQYQ